MVSMRLYVLCLASLALSLIAGNVTRVPPDTITTTEIVDGTILPDVISNPGRGAFSICGDAVTINANTVYYGPSIDLAAGTSGGQKCDITAAGSTTETDVNAVVYKNTAFRILGMTCRNEQDADASVLFTLRDDEASAGVSTFCSITDNDRDCQMDVQTTRDTEANSKMSISAFSVSDVGAANGFNCQIEVAF